MLKFDIEKRDGLARVGVIHTPHGDIKTPAFVGAATRATVKALTMKQMNELGSQAILANTYHLILRPGVELIKEAGGLAEFCSWHKPTFTDSGGFQIFSLPDVKITEESVKFKSHIDGANFEITPELSMQAQWAIGADIHMAFDHLAKSEDKKDMEEAMHRTHRWLDRCVAEHQRIKSSNATDGKFEAVRDDGSGIASEPRDDGRERSGSRNKYSKFLRLYSTILSLISVPYARYPISSASWSTTPVPQNGSNTVVPGLSGPHRLIKICASLGGNIPTFASRAGLA